MNLATLLVCLLLALLVFWAVRAVRRGKGRCGSCTPGTDFSGPCSSCSNASCPLKK